MFILKRKTLDFAEICEFIGNSYVLIFEKSNIIDFESQAKVSGFSDKETLNNIYGFISYNGGASSLPLYKKSKYHIMVSNGDTFEDISFLN